MDNDKLVKEIQVNNLIQIVTNPEFSQILSRNELCEVKAYLHSYVSETINTNKTLNKSRKKSKI